MQAVRCPLAPAEANHGEWDTADELDGPAHLLTGGPTLHLGSHGPAETEDPLRPLRRLIFPFFPRGEEVEIKLPLVSSLPSFLNAFVDWGHDGDFATQSSEKHVLRDVPLAAGSEEWTGWIRPPDDAMTGPTHLRLRLSSEPLGGPGRLPWEGIALGGEVEEHWIQVTEARPIREPSGPCAFKEGFEERGVASTYLLVDNGTHHSIVERNHIGGVTLRENYPPLPFSDGYALLYDPRDNFLYLLAGPSSPAAEPCSSRLYRAGEDRDGGLALDDGAFEIEPARCQEGHVPRLIVPYNGESLLIERFGPGDWTVTRLSLDARPSFERWPLSVEGELEEGEVVTTLAHDPEGAEGKLMYITSDGRTGPAEVRLDLDHRLLILGEPTPLMDAATELIAAAALPSGGTLAVRPSGEVELVDSDGSLTPVDALPSVLAATRPNGALDLCPIDLDPEYPWEEGGPVHWMAGGPLPICEAVWLGPTPPWYRHEPPQLFLDGGRVPQGSAWPVVLPLNSAGPALVFVTVLVDWRGDRSFGGPMSAAASNFQVSLEGHGPTDFEVLLEAPEGAKVGLVDVMVRLALEEIAPPRHRGKAFGGEVMEFKIEVLSRLRPLQGLEWPDDHTMVITRAGDLQTLSLFTGRTTTVPSSLNLNHIDLGGWHTEDRVLYGSVRGKSNLAALGLNADGQADVMELGLQEDDVPTSHARLAGDILPGPPRALLQCLAEEHVECFITELPGSVHNLRRRAIPLTEGHGLVLGKALVLLHGAREDGTVLALSVSPRRHLVALSISLHPLSMAAADLGPILFGEQPEEGQRSMARDGDVTAILADPAGNVYIVESVYGFVFVLRGMTDPRSLEAPLQAHLLSLGAPRDILSSARRVDMPLFQEDVCYGNLVSVLDDPSGEITHHGHHDGEGVWLGPDTDQCPADHVDDERYARYPVFFPGQMNAIHLKPSAQSGVGSVFVNLFTDWGFENGREWVVSNARIEPDAEDLSPVPFYTPLEAQPGQRLLRLRLSESYLPSTPSAHSVALPSGVTFDIPIMVATRQDVYDGVQILGISSEINKILLPQTFAIHEHEYQEYREFNFLGLDQESGFLWAWDYAGPEGSASGPRIIRIGQQIDSDADESVSSWQAFSCAKLGELEVERRPTQAPSAIISLEHGRPAHLLLRIGLSGPFILLNLALQSYPIRWESVNEFNAAPDLPPLASFSFLPLPLVDAFGVEPKNEATLFAIVNIRNDAIEDAENADGTDGDGEALRHTFELLRGVLQVDETTLEYERLGTLKMKDGSALTLPGSFDSHAFEQAPNDGTLVLIAANSQANVRIAIEMEHYATDNEFDVVFESHVAYRYVSTASDPSEHSYPASPDSYNRGYQAMHLRYDWHGADPRDDSYCIIGWSPLQSGVNHEGVAWPMMKQEEESEIQVYVSGAQLGSYLNVFVDWQANGTFEEMNEASSVHVTQNLFLEAPDAWTGFHIRVPFTDKPGRMLWARLRLSEYPLNELAPHRGTALGGEVRDIQVMISPPQEPFPSDMECSLLTGPIWHVQDEKIVFLSPLDQLANNDDGKCVGFLENGDFVIAGIDEDTGKPSMFRVPTFNEPSDLSASFIMSDPLMSRAGLYVACDAAGGYQLVDLSLDSIPVTVEPLSTEHFAQAQGISCETIHFQHGSSGTFYSVGVHAEKGYANQLLRGHVNEFSQSVEVTLLGTLTTGNQKAPLVLSPPLRSISDSAGRMVLVDRTNDLMVRFNTTIIDSSALSKTAYSMYHFSEYLTATQGVLEMDLAYSEGTAPAYYNAPFEEGARHLLHPTAPRRLWLGGVDPSTDAIHTPMIYPTKEATLSVQVNGLPGEEGFLNLWMDFLREGSFENTECDGGYDPVCLERRVLFDYPVTAGRVYEITFDVPAAAVPGHSWARARLTTKPFPANTTPWTGQVLDGDVFDFTYEVDYGIKPLGSCDTYHLLTSLKEQYRILGSRPPISAQGADLVGGGCDAHSQLAYGYLPAENKLFQMGSKNRSTVLRFLNTDGPVHPVTAGGMFMLDTPHAGPQSVLVQRDAEGRFFTINLDNPQDVVEQVEIAVDLSPELVDVDWSFESLLSHPSKRDSFFALGSFTGQDEIFLFTGVLSPGSISVDVVGQIRYPGGESLPSSIDITKSWYDEDRFINGLDAESLSVIRVDTTDFDRPVLDSAWVVSHAFDPWAEIAIRATFDDIMTPRMPKSYREGRYDDGPSHIKLKRWFEVTMGNGLSARGATDPSIKVPVMIRNQTASVLVPIQSRLEEPGYLNVFVDWDGGGDYIDPEKHVIINRKYDSGLVAHVSLTTPELAVLGHTKMLVRVTTYPLAETHRPWSGRCIGGEVMMFDIIVAEELDPLDHCPEGTWFTTFDNSGVTMNSVHLDVGLIERAKFIRGTLFHNPVELSTVKLTAFGWDTKNDFIWGWNAGTENLIQIGRDPETEKVVAQEFEVATEVTSDDDRYFDPIGGDVFETDGSVFLLQTDGRQYFITDLALKETPVKMTRVEVSGAEGYAVGDIAFSPLEGAFYAIANRVRDGTSGNALLRGQVDVDSMQLIMEHYPLDPLLMTHGPFEAAWFSKEGELFSFNGQSGTTVRVDLKDGTEGFTTEYLSYSTPRSVLDGARCHLSPVPNLPADMGDAFRYDTVKHHLIEGAKNQIWIGRAPDQELISGDDLRDETPIVVSAPFVGGLSGKFGLKINGSEPGIPGFLNVFVDWGASGNFEGAAKHVLINSKVYSGNEYAIEVPVPTYIAGGEHTWLRTRLTEHPINLRFHGWEGGVVGGEVEDHRIDLVKGDLNTVTFNRAYQIRRPQPTPGPDRGSPEVTPSMRAKIAPVNRVAKAGLRPIKPRAPATPKTPAEAAPKAPSRPRPPQDAKAMEAVKGRRKPSGQEGQRRPAPGSGPQGGKPRPRTATLRTPPRGGRGPPPRRPPHPQPSGGRARPPTEGGRGPPPKGPPPKRRPDGRRPPPRPSVTLRAEGGRRPPPRGLINDMLE